MATFDLAVAPTDPARIAAEKAFSTGGPLSREAAAARLAELGITPPATDSQQSTYTPPAVSAADYAIDLIGVSLPDEADPIAVAAGAAEFCAALNLPPYVGNAIGRDMAASENPDPAIVAKQLDNINIQYADAIEAVDKLIAAGSAKRGEKIEITAKSLSAFALSQLYAYAQIEQRRSQR